MFLRLTLLIIGLAASYIGSLCFQNGSAADMAVGGGIILIGILCFFFLAKGLWRFLGCMTTFVIMAVIFGVLFFFISGSGVLENFSEIISSKMGAQTAEQSNTGTDPAMLPADPTQQVPQQSPQIQIPTVGLPPGMAQQIKQTPPPSVVTGKISSISSGDVFRIGQNTIRLYGLASPMIDQICQDGNGHDYECGYVSARMLKDFVSGDDVKCRVMSINAQNELMAACAVGTFDIGAAMVEAGWAIALPAVTPIYLPYQQKAQNNHKGMWEGHFQMPWEWMTQKQQTLKRAQNVKMPKIKISPPKSKKKGKSIFDYF